MVPEKLLAYLREKKQKGYPDEMIKCQFLQRGWPALILEEAYAQINGVKEASTADAAALGSIITTNHEPATQTETPEHLTTEAPALPELPKKWLMSLTVLFLLLSEHYSGHASRFLFVLLTLQSSLSKAGGAVSILSTYPTIFIAIIIALIVGIYYFYLAFRTRSFSEKSWRLGALSLVCIPFVYYPLLNLLSLPIFKQVAEMSNTSIGVLYPGIDLGWSLGLGYVLWRTKKLQVYPDTGVSNKVRIWLVIVTVVSVLILIAAGVVMGKSSTMGDLGYANVSEQVDYKLYKMSALPANLSYTVKYEKKTEEDGSESVRFALGTPLAEVREGNDIVIVVSQKKLIPGYEVTSDFAGFEEAIEQVTVLLAKDQIGYFGRKPFGSGFLANLTFVTGDGVVVNMRAPNVELPVLLDLANRLE